MMMDVAAPSPRDDAARRFRLLSGLDEVDAGKLVDAAVQGATDHVYELLNGSGPVSTSMTTERANQLRYVCERAGRLLTQREVEILFRITSTTAKTVLSSMSATYAEALRTKFLDRMRTDVAVEQAGNQDGGLRWKLRFGESNSYDIAETELRRQGVGGEIVPEGVRTFSVPQEVTVNGSTVDSLTLLGVAKPPAKKNKK